MKPSKINKLLSAAVLTSLFSISHNALAKEYYVQFDTELRSALKEAAHNRENDVIYINTGVFEVNENLSYTPDNDEIYSLEIKPAPNITNRVYVQRKSPDTFLTIDLSKYTKSNKISISIENITFEDFYRNNDVRRDSYFKIKGENLKLSVKNCGFLRSNAVNSGGAFNLEVSKSFLEFVNNVFVRNATNEKGASIFIKGEKNRILIDRNRFIAGKAKEAGAVYGDLKGSLLFFLNNTVMGNKLYRLTGEKAGAIYLTSENSNYYFVNNYFFSNVSNGTGGAIFAQSNGGYSYFNKNQFIYNYSRNDVAGGMYLKFSNGKLKIIDNRFEYNMSDGGAGSVLELSNVNLLFSNNIVQQNMAGMFSGIGNKKGGGLYIDSSGSKLKLFNNTVYANSSAVEGGGVYIKTDNDQEVTLANNIFWQNYTLGNKNSGYDVYIDNNTSVSLLNNDYSYLFVKDNDLITLSGNIDNDPVFENPYTGNLHLSPDSPCIDAGLVLDDPDFSKIKEDIDGDKRVEGNSVDIGADEFVEGQSKPKDKEIIIIENPDEIENLTSGNTSYAKVENTDNKVALVCVDTKPKKPIVGYAWDINGDGVVDVESEKSIIILNKSEIQNVECTITYYDGSKETVKLEKKN